MKSKVGSASLFRQPDFAEKRSGVIVENPKISNAEREFAKCIAAHQRDLVSLAYRFVGNFEDARDLAQWAFARLWLHRENLKAEREVFYYLRRILVNLCIDHLRRREPEKEDLSASENRLLESEPDPLQALERQEWQALLARSIAQLKPKQKATIILRDLEGYSVAETAALLSCTENNVLCNLHLARKNVKQKMQQWLSPHELLS